MSYDSAKKAYSKDHIHIVDILADFCSLEYADGSEAALSTLPTVGDEAGTDDGTAGAGVTTTTFLTNQLVLNGLSIPAGEAITMTETPTAGQNFRCDFYYAPSGTQEFPPIQIGHQNVASSGAGGLQLTIDASGLAEMYWSSTSSRLSYQLLTTERTKIVRFGRSSFFFDGLGTFYAAYIYVDGEGVSDTVFATTVSLNADNAFQVTRLGSATSDIIVSDVRLWSYDNDADNVNYQTPQDSYRLTGSEAGLLAYWPMADATPGCLAELGVTGSRKCYNTLGTCQSRGTYLNEIKRYRHVEPRADLPPGLNLAVPDVAGVDLSPTEIDIGGGLGRRAALTVTFADHPSSDIGIDKYRDERISGAAQADGAGYDPKDRGTYWGKFRARNPFYLGDTIEHLSGYIVNGEFDEANFQKRTYIAERLSNPNSSGSLQLVAKDPLKLTDLDRAQCPTPNTGQLQADIDDTVTSATLIPAGIGNAEYSASGTLRINSEVMTFTRSGDDLTLTRAQEGTEADSHEANELVQECYVFSSETVDDVIKALLTGFADVPSEYIPSSDWATEAADNFGYSLNAVIADPVSVKDLLIELAESAPHQLWWDERENLIRFQAIKAPSGSLVEINDNANFIVDSVQIKDVPERRVSQVWFRYGQRDPTEDLEEVRNYRRLYVRADLQSQSDYGSKRIKTIFSRWITAANQTFARDTASLIGRRWARIPRMATFAMLAKDNDVWAGDVVALRHRNLQDDTGLDAPRNFQVISVQETSGDRYQYKAMEVLFAQTIPEDDEAPVYNLFAEDGALSIDIRDEFERNIGPVPNDPITLNYTVPSGVTIGGDYDLGFTLKTGTFPSNVTLKLIISSDTFGHGGIGGQGGYAILTDNDNDRAGKNGGDGGDSIVIDHDCTITIDSGVTVECGYGGGGGGGGFALRASGFFKDLDRRLGGGGGGGGLGSPGGIGGQGGNYFDPDFTTNEDLREGNNGSNGTAIDGGSGGTGLEAEGDVSSGDGGAGGDSAASATAGTASEPDEDPDPDIRTEIGPGGAAGSAGRAIVNTGTFNVEIDNNGTITGTVVGPVTYI